MATLAVICLIAYLSFSLGMIAGCLIMTKGDTSSEPKLPEEDTPEESHETVSLENAGEVVGK